MKELKTLTSKTKKVQTIGKNIDELKLAYENLKKFSTEEILSKGDAFTFEYESLNVIYDAIELNLASHIAETDKMGIILSAEKLLLKRVKEKLKEKAQAITDAKSAYCESTITAEKKFNELTELKAGVDSYIKKAYQSSQKEA